jgi:hypothetical protein
MTFADNMKLPRKKKTPLEAGGGLTRTEALAGIPQRAPSATWVTLENGDILIEYPLNIKPFFIQLANRFQKDVAPRPTKKLQLDGMGSSVWQMFDGEKDVKAIIREVSKQSGLSLQEAEISVTTFLRQLGRRGLILMS